MKKNVFIHKENSSYLFFTFENKTILGFTNVLKDRPDFGEYNLLMSQLLNELIKVKDNVCGTSSSSSDSLLGYSKLDVTMRTKVLNLQTWYQQKKTYNCIRVKLPYTPFHK